MDPQLPEVERLQVIDVQPGDTIVATVPANTRSSWPSTAPETGQPRD